MIGGLSGHGKTLILLSITKALLAGKGERLWDLFDVEENGLRVVYLIPECAIQPFKHRSRLLGLYDYLAPNDNRLLVRTLSKGPAPLLSDPRILFAVKGAHCIHDTATRFGDGDENSASDNQKGLATDIFALLGAGAKSVIAAHHSPKTFKRENFKHPSGPLFQSWLADGHIVKAAGQVDIQWSGADVCSIHMDVRTSGSGSDVCVYISRRSWRL